MNRIKRPILLMILLVTLLMLPGTVFAKEPGVLKISGPGIRGQRIINPDGWSKLEDSWFFAQDSRIKQAPNNLGEGYTLIPYLGIDGKMIAYTEIVYYPTKSGMPGYFHYTGRWDGKILEPVDEWGVSSWKADRAFRALMASNQIALQPSSFSAAPNRATLIVLSLIAVLFTTMGIVVISKRYVLRQRTA